MIHRRLTKSIFRLKPISHNSINRRKFIQNIFFHTYNRYLLNEAQFKVPKHYKNVVKQTISNSNDNTNIFGQSSFRSLGLRDDILKAVESLSFEMPTLIQEMVIPRLLKSQSPTIFAERTGTGKTMAYLLPIIHKLKQEEIDGNIFAIEKRPRAIIIVPSRELAVQVTKNIKHVSHFSKLKSASITGLLSTKKEADILAGSLDIVVCTPGRLIEHFKNQNVYLSRVKYLVIDEVDVLLNDSDFFKAVESIINSLKAKEEKNKLNVQYIFACASITESLMNIMNSLFQDIKKVVSPDVHKIVPSLKQEWIHVTSDKKDKLLSILKKKNPNQRIMIFCNTISSCRWVHHFVTENNIKASCYHGDMPILKRKEEFNLFLKGDSNILICTDIASRGIDLEVDHVILFDFPLNSVDYIHRIGRTARANKDGKVTNFILKRDRVLADSIQKAIKNKTNLDGITSSINSELVSKRRILKKPIDQDVQNDQKINAD